MASNLDRNSTQRGPSFDPSPKLLQDFPQFEGAAISAHPVHLTGHVSNIDPEKHVAALNAFGVAVTATAQVYQVTALLSDYRQALEGHAIRQGAPVPGAGSRWNAETDKYRAAATKAFEAAAQVADGAEESLSKTSQALESQITSTIKIPLSESVQSEIRSLLRGANNAKNPSGAKLQLAQLVSSGDRAAIAAVLSAPAFLSGLDASDVDTYAEAAAQKHAPDLVLQRDAVQGLRNSLKANRGIAAEIFSQGMAYAKPVQLARPQGYADTPRVKH